MIYAVPYHPRFPHKRDENLELIFKYDPKSNSLSQLLQEYAPSHSIVIDIPEQAELRELDYKLLASFCRLYSSVRVKFFLKQQEVRKNVKSHAIRYFYSDHISNWDVLCGILEEKVSDIYITDDLGFSLETISNMAKAAGVKIRIFPNVAQSRWADTEPIKKFFVRPEDITWYQQFVDICEIFAIDKNVQQFSAYYDIYKSKQWIGDLNTLIIGLNKNVRGDAVPPNFGEYRSHCDKMCTHNRGCSYCLAIEDLQKVMAAQKMYFERKDDDGNEGR